MEEGRDNKRMMSYENSLD